MYLQICFVKFQQYLPRLRNQQLCITPIPSLVFAAMVLQRIRTHPRALSLQMMRKVYVLRKGKKPPPPWPEIAQQVRNLKGDTPYWKVCRDAFNRLEKPSVSTKDAYHKCGRKPVLTKPICKWIVARMLSLRRKMEIHSTGLQALLAKEKHIIVHDSSIRKVLKNAGYKYLTRGKKPKYDAKQKETRLTFGKKYATKSQREIDDAIDFFMDGVVWTVPPKNETERENYCRSDIRKVWRRPDEHELEDLAGYDKYAKQVPHNRIVPMWGGISRGGFASVLWHEDRKTNDDEWSNAINDRCLINALKAVNPVKKSGPWKIISDNESFLRADESKKAYRRFAIHLIEMPPRSPDLNPVEKMWGWVRKELRARDLRDFAGGVPVLAKAAYRERIKRLLRSSRAQAVAKNIARNFRTVCKRVVKAKGAAVRG